MKADEPIPHSTAGARPTPSPHPHLQMNENNGTPTRGSNRMRDIEKALIEAQQLGCSDGGDRSERENAGDIVRCTILSREYALTSGGEAETPCGGPGHCDCAAGDARPCPAHVRKFPGHAIAPGECAGEQPCPPTRRRRDANAVLLREGLGERETE